MELLTFVDSAYALVPYFTLCARKGLEFSGKEEELPGMFEELRSLGKESEKIMRTAAKGANPHKGMIFSGGIFCFCAGYGAGSLKMDFQDEDFPKVLSRLCRCLTENLLEDYKNWIRFLPAPMVKNCIRSMESEESGERLQKGIPMYLTREFPF